MLKITLARTGKKNQAFFRIVVTEKGQDPWGTIIANLGNYNPRSKALALDMPTLEKFLKNGAQPSDTVHNLLVTKGIIKDKKRAVTNISDKKKKAIDDAKKKDEENKAKVAAAAEAKAAKEVAEKAAADEKAKADAEAAKAAAEVAAATPAPEAVPEAPATETPAE